MADYRDHYSEIRSVGANVVAVSVDAPEKSERVRAYLSLPFPILCDTEHRVVRDWGIYNSREKGGIAKPAVFIIERNHVVSYSSVDTVAKRVPAAETVFLLQNGINSTAIRRRVHVPRFSQWTRAIRNGIRR